MKKIFSSGDSYKTETDKPGFFTQFKESFKTAYSERMQEGTQRVTGTGAGAGLLANEAGHTAEPTSDKKKGTTHKQ